MFNAGLHPHIAPTALAFLEEVKAIVREADPGITVFYPDTFTGMQGFRKQLTSDKSIWDCITGPVTISFVKILDSNFYGSGIEISEQDIGEVEKIVRRLINTAVRALTVRTQRMAENPELQAELDAAAKSPHDSIAEVPAPSGSSSCSMERSR